MYEDLEQILSQLVEASEARNAAMETMNEAISSLNAASRKYDAAMEALADALGKMIADSKDNAGNALQLLGGRNLGDIGGFGLPNLSNLFGDLF